MNSVLKGLCLGATAAWLLAGAAANGFTIENKEAGEGGTRFTGGPYAAPKFDIEEQARNFRSGGSSIASPGNKTDFSTPLGNGSVTYGVQQGSAFGSSMGFGPGSLGPVSGSRANRADFERMVTPDNLR